MAVRMFEKAVLYIKETQEIGLFGVMVDSRWFAAFSGSPFYYVMLPFIGILLTALTVINGYQLATAENQNFDKWSVFFVSVVGATLASVSLYGGVIATLLGSTFAAGPWFFLASVVLAGMHQAVMLGINLYRAYESLNGSSQGMHHLQAALNNAFLISLLAAISGAVTFVMLTPVAPVLGSCCAFAAVALTGASILWRITPYNWKQAIKNFFYLGKVDLVLNEEQIQLSIKPYNTSFVEDSLKSNTQYRLFTKFDYKAAIKTMNFAAANQYITEVLTQKIDTLCAHTTAKNDVNIQKIEFLLDLSTQLEAQNLISKADLLEKYPLAFQSFWAEKGDVEQIFDAVLALQARRKETQFYDVYGQEESVQPATFNI